MKGEFYKIVNEQTPVLVDFFAEWCGPCKAQSPIIKELAQEVNGKVRIIKIDIDKNQAVAQRYNVRGVPTLVLFQAGEIVWRQSGVHSKSQLINVIKQHTSVLG
ncbi:thioredoxin [uncultured Winogradskyella sp.]|uniref:thioredoxin n=1 Tax=uncultured Winogradskyella sp. TaxID=395353 RepID=UPI002630E3AD|nr:thioredoxin [uncultured Winogradskyella sp.]|tara:strand:- start:221 stop:532 length:312 start_codon:yes stop_codon:yes gene_type:complete